MRGKKSKAKRRRELLGLVPPKMAIRQAAGDLSTAARDGLIDRKDIPALYPAVLEMRTKGVRPLPLVRARAAVQQALPSSVATVLTLMRDTKQKGEVRLAAAKTIGEWGGIALEGSAEARIEMDAQQLAQLLYALNQEISKREGKTIEGESTPVDPDPAS